MSNESAKSSGVGFLGLLGLALIILKLCKVIDWSWWWVLAPIWGPVALLIICLIGYLLFKNRPDKRPPKPRPKSKWEQRLEEVQKQRNASK